MSIVDEITLVFEQEGAQMIRDLQALMVSTGANASGRTSASLANEVNVTPSRAQMRITGGEGWAFVEQGRGRTRRKGSGKTLRQIIREWIDFKGITPEDGMSKDTLAFLITRAIHARGTLLHLLGERREIYTAVFTEARLQKLITTASDRAASVIEGDIYNKIKSLA